MSAPLIRVAFIGVGCRPMPLFIPDDLPSIQALVGGTFDRRQLGGGLDLCFCDDGLGDGMAPNLRDVEHGLFIVGNAFVARLLPEDVRASTERDYGDVSDADLALVRGWVESCERLRFEYDIPAPRFITGTGADLHKPLPPMPLPRVEAIEVFDDVRVEVHEAEGAT